MTRRYSVRMTRGAEQDLAALYAYRAVHAGDDAADALLDAVATKIDGLRHLPERGAVPKELEALAIADYRQILCPPYRIIYRVIDAMVFIMLIADGRRDVGSLLERRLLAL